MKKDNIPFKIGMQYENWEFSLDILPDRIKGYDCYLNIDKSLNKFLNVHSDRTELLFNLDILEGVILTFENRTTDFYKDLKGITFSDIELLGRLNIRCLLKCEDYYFTLGLSLIYKDKMVHLFYCKSKILKDVVNTL